jgi:long-chain fatty acid transport protein
MRRCALLSAFMVLLSSLACAQLLPALRITSSPNPIGSGARATAMGGAFISIADDASAASWNPAGLVQLGRPEVSIVGEDFMRLEDLYSSAHPESDSDSDYNISRLNYISAAWPFRLWERNFVVSLNYQRLYGFERDMQFDFNTDNGLVQQNGKYSFEQEGNLYALSPAIAFRLGPRLAIGATLNIWRDVPGRDYSWKTKTLYTGNGVLEGTDHFDSAFAVRDEYSDFRGENFNLGMRWVVNEKVTLGAVFKSPFTARLKHRRYQLTTIDFTEPDLPPDSGILEFSRKEEMEFPWSAGIGCAIRWDDYFTTSMDITRTEWDDFVLEDDQGNRVSAVTGISESEEDIDPTYTVRLGLEYLHLTEQHIIPLRCGAFYDPEPSSHHPDDYAGFSCGSGLIADGYSLDFSYTYRFGNNVGGDVVDIPGARIDTDQHQFLLSLIKYF